MERRLKLDNLAIILVQPQIPENIGACARAMNNMGLTRLILVKPENCDLSRVVKMATGNSIDIIQEMECVDDFLAAIGPFQYIVGTTARIGARRPAILNPRQLAHELLDVSQHNQIAILFGPEDRGLSNEHLRYCHTIATIPTIDFSSLNLAQAVMVFCYELALRSQDAPETFVPRLADKSELEHMYDHLKAAFLKIGFINPENPEHWMLNIRRFLSRYQLRGREVKIIRGICRQIDWYTEQLERFKIKERDARGWEDKGSRGQGVGDSRVRTKSVEVKSRKRGIQTELKRTRMKSIKNHPSKPIS